MRRHSSHAFTLIEILTVIVIILIITAWVVGAYGPAQKAAARRRAQAEIKLMENGCEGYKADFGSYPRMEGVTEAASTGNSPIDPKLHGNPTTSIYKKSSQFLYGALSGDKNFNGTIDSDEPQKPYLPFDKTMLSGIKDANGKYSKIEFISDPFGNSYGYSTAGARSEEEFRAAAAASASAQRDPAAAGYNPNFDLWSTSGKVTAVGTPLTDIDRNGWVKNW